MVALSTHIIAHRSLHVLRASLVSQFNDHREYYDETGSLGSKGACLAFEQAVKEIDALLDDGPTVLAADRDRLDHLENHGRMNGSDPDQGTDGARKPKVGAWGNWLTFALLATVVFALYILKPGE